MTFEENHAKPHRKNGSKQRERTTASEKEAGEKSLLSFIQERRADQDRRTSKLVSDVTGRLPIGKVDDVDEDDRPELDHMFIRLGGNGF